MYRHLILIHMSFLHMFAAEYSQIEAWEKPAHFRLYSRLTVPHVLWPLMGMRATSVGVVSGGMFCPMCGFCYSSVTQVFISM